MKTTNWNASDFLTLPLEGPGRSGGTVARLWRKNTSRFNERVNEVNKGPSEEALADGVKVYCGPGVMFYDNYLSSEMDAFVCGQYLAREGKDIFSICCSLSIKSKSLTASSSGKMIILLHLKYIMTYNLFSNRVLSQSIVAQA